MLIGALERALAGRAEVVVLAGEPGIGKTRLAEELSAIALSKGARVLWARSDEWEGSPPYWPWVQILRALIRDVPQDALQTWLGHAAADVAQLLPELRDRLTGLATSPATEPEQARFRLFDGISQLLVKSATKQPVMLVFDDLHWADQPSMLLLRFFVRELQAAPILLVGTYRTVEVGRQHPLLEVLAAVTRDLVSQRVLLRGLAAGDIARYLALAVGHEPPADLVESVYRETEGNPFFVTEVVRLLAVEGRLTHAPATWTTRVPESVREVLARRFARLSTGSIELLEMATVIGREFSLPVLERVSRLDVDALLDVLDEAIQAQVIQEQPVIGHYRFNHVLFQETLYERLSVTQRVRLHARAAEALEQLHVANLDPVLADIARHYFQASPLGRARQAIDYAQRAAAQAGAQLAWEDAVRHFERALQAFDLLEQPDEQQRIALLLDLSEAQFRSGDAKTASQTRARAIPLIRHHGTAEQLARAAISRGMGGWGYPFADRETRDLLEEALRTLPDGDSPLRAQALTRLATALHHLPGSLERRIALSDEAIAMARRLGDAELLAFVLIAQIPTFWDPDQRTRWRAALDGCHLLVERSGNSLLDSFVHLGREMLAMEAGDVSLADHHLTSYARIRGQLRLPSSLWEVVTRQAGRALLAGDFETAMRLATDARDLGERVYPVEWQPSYEYWSLVFLVYSLQGRHAEREQIARRFLAHDPADRYWLCRAALSAAEQGKVDEARATVERLAVDDFAGLTYGPWWHANLPPLIEACVLLGDTRRAAQLYALMRPFADRNIHEITIYYGSGAHYLGLLAALLSRVGDAERHFEDALVMNGRLQARPFLARTLSAYAGLLMTRGVPHDRAKARELATTALVEAEALGMAPLTQQALAVVEAATLSVRPPQYPAGLTQREVDVLRLLAAGKSNREIADTLAMSVRTAERHIANLYVKIDASSRAEAIAFAHRHALN